MALKQAVRFALVGVVATAVHYVTAVGLASLGHLDPRSANFIGFLVAFGVSFLGQWKWTFGDRDVPVWSALPAYFAVSSGSFLLNAFLFELMLRFTPLPYTISLALVLGAVALTTFLLSRAWAFRIRRPGEGGGFRR